MEYLKVRWLHESQDDPLILMSELDVHRYEIRKVEIFADGRIGYASESQCSQGTSLGELPIPRVDEIMKDPQFLVEETDVFEFEESWAMATKN
jgi:hypothetical protein